ncbi:MAG TPA: DNA-formamidopyrimidine glycosylase family protein, partial [Marinobacter sp.]|nr:DNA-formamidopyrimidine glycosylase family protein [Marinobacter sp.]
MPEGPEIRRMVDDIERAIGGKTAEAVFFAFDELQSYQALLRRRQILGVEARSKAVLVHFAGTDQDGPWSVYSHNQLYGKWRTGRANRPPNTRRQLRFAVETANKAAWLFSASDIQVVRPDELDDIPYLAKLGPDPLNQAVGIDDLVTRLCERRFRGRGLGGLLLDQGFIAGIGNYLRSEILFEARLSPERRPADLTNDDKTRLAVAVLTMLKRAYELKGITMDP